MNLTIKNFWAHRKQNGFVFAEIILITVLSFYFIDHFVVTTYDHYFCRPAGDFEREHLVVGQVGQTPSPLPLKGEDGHLSETEDVSSQTHSTLPLGGERGGGLSLSSLYALRDRIRALPEVQSASLTTYSGFIGSHGELSYRRSSFAPETDSTRRCGAMQNFFLLHEQYFETQGLRPIEGSPSLDALSDNCPSDGAVISRSLAIALFGTDQALGRRFVEWDFSDRALQQTGEAEITNRYTVAGVLEDFRLSSYERYAYSILTPMTSLSDLTPELLIRLRPEVDAEAFVSRLSANLQEDFREGTSFLVSLKTYRDYLRQYSTNDSHIANTLLGILLALFLLNVILGTLGTYWLQLRKRTEDIGIMRSFGAKRRHIFGMIWSEAALLTLVAAVIGQIIWLQFAFNIDLSDGWTMSGTNQEKDWVNTFWLHYLIICAVQYVLLLAVVTLGIIVPALIAMYRKPVNALRHE